MLNSLRFLLSLSVVAMAGVSCASNASNPEVICSSLAAKNLPAETLATVNGEPITSEQLEKSIRGRAKGSFMKAQAEYFEAKKDALDEYLFSRLVEELAKKQGKTVEQVTDAEVTKKTKKVSDRDIQAFYDKIKKQREAFGQKMPPMEKKISDQIRANLENEKAKERKDAFFAELRSIHKVAYLVDSPRSVVDVGTNPAKGNDKAQVTIVEFSDFQCPYCKRAAQTVEEVVKAFPGKVRLYFRDFPLGFHDKAKAASMAARCASEQGKFWQYHDKLFAKQELASENLSAYAKELKLDTAKFEECLKSEKYRGEVEKDMEAGSELGVTGTPAFFVNGKMLSGALPAEAFKDLINQELARAKK